MPTFPNNQSIDPTVTVDFAQLLQPSRSRPFAMCTKTKLAAPGLPSLDLAQRVIGHMHVQGYS